MEVVSSDAFPGQGRGYREKGMGEAPARGDEGGEKWKNNISDRKMAQLGRRLLQSRKQPTDWKERLIGTTLVKRLWKIKKSLQCSQRSAQKKTKKSIPRRSKKDQKGLRRKKTRRARIRYFIFTKKK